MFDMRRVLHYRARRHTERRDEVLGYACGVEIEETYPIDKPPDT